MGRTIVIGGGFAGLAAAARLANDGFRPLLLEQSPRLGGRASSFVDRRTGETVDDGQHILMRCCTVTQGFLRRLDALDAVAFQPNLDIPIAWEGLISRLRSRLLPGPLHLAPSLLGYSPLSVGERLDAIRAAIGFYGRTRTDMNFADWLAERGQSTEAMDRLWDPLAICALNAPACEVSQSAARKLFRDAFLRPGGADIGLFTRPLRRIAETAAAYIEARDAEVRTGAGVKAIETDGHRVTRVVLRTGETIDADAVLCAVPSSDARRLLSDSVALFGAEPHSAPAVPGQADALDWAPIVNLHLWYDRPVMDEPFLLSVDSELQTVFRHASDAPGAVERLTISQSAASAWMARTDDEIREALVADLCNLLPATRETNPVHASVVRSPRATFVPAPGADRLRPGSVTEIDALYLAGDWTATGWPSTIEGAVRSGIAAAAHLENEQQARVSAE